MFPFHLQQYQSSLTNDFSVSTADGATIVSQLAEDISRIFTKNKAALKVSSSTIGMDLHFNNETNTKMN